MTLRLSLAILLVGVLAVSAAPSGPEWTENEVSEQRQAASELLASLKDQLASGQKAITIPPGDYRFDAPAEHVSFTDLTDVVIEASGATFWFDPRSGKGLRFTNCRRVVLRGLTIDSDPLPWFQGAITEVDRKARTVTFASDRGYLPPAGEMLTGANRVLFFDPDTARELPVFDDRVLVLEDIGEGRARIAKFHTDRIFDNLIAGRGVRPGDRIAILLKEAGGSNIVLRNCGEMTLQDVTNYGAGGFAFHEATGEGGNHYLRCRLIRRPGTNRLMASRSDALHSYLVARGPTIEHCELSHAGDDLIAIHGFFGVVMERLSPKELLVAAPFGRIVEVGSEIQVFDPLKNETRTSVRVVALEELIDAGVLARARALPADLLADEVRVRDLESVQVFRVNLDAEVEARPMDLTSSGDYCGRGAIVRDNRLHDGHVRGVLAKTEDLLVERNRIERTQCAGIVIESEYYWLEGPFNRRIRIVGNALSDNGWAAFDRGGFTFSFSGIHVGAYFGQRLFPRTLPLGWFNFDVEIRDNTIARPAGPGVFAANTAGLRIMGNKIDAPFAAGIMPRFYDWSKLGPAPDGRMKDLFHAIVILNSKDVTSENNTTTNAPAFLRNDGASFMPGPPAGAR